MTSHSPLVMVAAGVLVFMLAALSDFLETRYVSAVNAHDARRAARCSVGMWLAGVIWLGAVLEVGWWVVLPEGAGLYVGTLVAMRGQSRDCQS